MRVHSWALAAAILVAGSGGPGLSQERKAPAEPRCREVRADGRIGLRNRHAELAFDSRTGALTSVRNLQTGDEYLKEPGAGNPFRCWLDPARLPRAATQLGWAAVVGPVEGNMGGRVVDPRDCRLIGSSFARDGAAGVLKLTLRHSDPALLFALDVRLPHDGAAADCSLTVRNGDRIAHKLMAAFPHFTGLCLGKSRDTNLGVRAFDAGLPGEAAWIDSGGVYGFQVSMQWLSVYDLGMAEGFSCIAMDPAVGSKILRRFPGGGMSVLCFPAATLEPGEEHRCPDVRLLVHRGNWRVAAREYRKWLAAAFKVRKPPEWLADVDVGSSLWVPPAKAVADAKKAGRGAITSFTQLPRVYYLNNQKDMVEWAMYWDGLRTCPEAYGAFGPDGIYLPRQDLGGAEAMRQAVEQLHRAGRRVVLYVAARHVRVNSPLFQTGGHTLKALARMPRPGHIAPNPHKSVELCAGCAAWQDHLAGLCRRLLRDTGVDGIRLDEFGGCYKPCFNPAHGHKSPYASIQWHRELLRKVRAAMDAVNPQSLLATENFTDCFHESASGALLMFYPGREIEAMRLAIPTYRGLAYHPGAAETALNGAIANTLYARRRAWPYDTAPAGFPRKPKHYAAGHGPRLRWHEMRATFRDATWHGEVADIDPSAADDPVWVGRLWKTPTYWLMVGGHEDASPLKGPVRVRLPELPGEVAHAYELDAATLKLREAPLRRERDGIFATVSSPFAAVLLPLPSCPPLVQVGGALALKAGQQTTLRLGLFAPWRPGPADAAVAVSLPGCGVAPRRVRPPASVRIHVPRAAEPGYYPLRVTGNCLPLKRWVLIRP